MSPDARAITDYKEENLVCKFNSYSGNEAEKIKFWYTDCEDEGQSWDIQPEAVIDYNNNNDDGSVSASVNKDHMLDGFYICCYDFANDVTAIDEVSAKTCDTLFDEGDVAFQNEKTKFGSGKDGYFQGKNNQKCEIHYVSGVMAASFPWWILLVIFLIVLIVLLAVWYYKKQKKQQKEDEEGDIDAKQDLEKNVAPVPAKDDPSLWAGNVPGETPGS